MVIYKQRKRKFANVYEKMKGGDDMMYPNLEAEMKRRQITRESLGKIIGVTTGHLSRKMTGQFDFTLAEAKKISDNFGCKIEYLFKSN